MPKMRHFKRFKRIKVKEMIRIQFKSNIQGYSNVIEYIAELYVRHGSCMMFFNGFQQNLKVCMAVTSTAIQTSRKNFLRHIFFEKNGDITLTIRTVIDDVKVEFSSLVFPKNFGLRP